MNISDKTLLNDAEHRDRGERGKLQDLIGRSPNSHLADQLTAMLDDIRGF